MDPEILSIGGTMVDDIGGLQSQPVVCSFGNINREKRKHANAWFVLGFIPSYYKTSVEREKDNRSVKKSSKYLQFYHKCLSIIFQDLKKIYCVETWFINGVYVCTNTKLYDKTVYVKPRLMHRWE